MKDTEQKTKTEEEERNKLVSAGTKAPLFEKNKRSHQVKLLVDGYSIMQQ